MTKQVYPLHPPKKRRFPLLRLLLILLALAALVWGCSRRISRSRVQKKAADAYLAVAEASRPRYGHLRFSLCLIDDDPIPELLLCAGTGGADPFWIYSFDPSSGHVAYWGAFSTRGYLSYYEKQSLFVSQYGNNGYFPNVYTTVEDGTPRLLAAEVLHLQGDGDRYHILYPMSAPFNGSRDDFDDALYERLVDQYEYETAMAALLYGYGKETCVHYDEMPDYTPEALRAAMK